MYGAEQVSLFSGQLGKLTSSVLMIRFFLHDFMPFGGLLIIKNSFLTTQYQLLATIPPLGPHFIPYSTSLGRSRNQTSHILQT